MYYSDVSYLGLSTMTSCNEVQYSFSSESDEPDKPLISPGYSFGADPHCGTLAGENRSHH
jgi:hypothetical protein